MRGEGHSARGAWRGLGEQKNDEARVAGLRIDGRLSAIDVFDWLCASALDNDGSMTSTSMTIRRTHKEKTFQGVPLGIEDKIGKGHLLQGVALAAEPGAALQACKR